MDEGIVRFVKIIILYVLGSIEYVIFTWCALFIFGMLLIVDIIAFQGSIPFLSYLSPFLPRAFSMGTNELIEAAVIISFLGGLMGRALGSILRRSGNEVKISLVQRLCIAIGILTICYIYILANVPSMKMAPGSSFQTAYAVFIFFYILTAASTAILIVISWAISRFISNFVDKWEAPIQ